MWFPVLELAIISQNLTETLVGKFIAIKKDKVSIYKNSSCALIRHPFTLQGKFE